MSALADTSLFIASEQHRPVAVADLGDVLVSVITVGELGLGVVLAEDLAIRARRLATLSFVQTSFEPLQVDAAAARAWSGLVGALRKGGRRAPINDTWIAAIALSRGLAVITQDHDYDNMPGVDVVHF